MRLFLIALLGLFIANATRTAALAGLTVNGYSAATADRYDRFNNSPAFLGSAYNWSGVGRTPDGRWGTLISPSFVISAAHLAPIAGTSLRFYTGNDAAGSFVDRTVGASIAITGTGLPLSSDLVLTQLSAPVTGISTYAIAAPTSPANLIGQEIYVWGQADTLPFQTSMRLGRNEIFNVIPNADNGVSIGTVFVYDYNTTTGLGLDEAKLVSGDSGGPSFLIGPSGPVIVGIHWFVNDPGTLTGPLEGSGDTLVSSYITQLNNAMAATGSSERVMVVAVPEPTAVAWLLLGVSSALVRRRRRSYVRQNVDS